MRRLLALFLGTALLTLPAVPAAAQEEACPVASPDVVSQAVGFPVQFEPPLMGGSCMFDDSAPGLDHTFIVSRSVDAFAQVGGPAGPAQLASALIAIPEELRPEVDAIHEVGFPVQLPRYQISLASGVGDGAVWIVPTDMPAEYRISTLLVQRGADAFAFGVFDGPEALTTATNLAQTVLASQPQ